MSVDSFRPRELADISKLAYLVENFNREQVGDKKLFAAIVFYRDGVEVATLTESAFDSASSGDLSFEVRQTL